MSDGRMIAKNTAVVGFFTGVSRVLGFVRDIIMAHIFGTTLASSAFALAWRLPNLFRAVLGEGALSAAFIPVLSEKLRKDGPKEADRLASSIFVMVGGVLMCLVGCGLMALLLISRFDLGQRWNSAVSISLITFPYVLFICLAALCMGVFHTRSRFLVPAVAQSFLNIVWIAALFFLCPRFGDSPMEQIYGVAWGVLGAGVVQLVFQAVFLRRTGFKFSLGPNFDVPEIRRFLRLMTPVFLGTGITQLNVFISGLLAMFAGTWAPAAFTFVERIVYAALGPIGTALGTVLLPTYARQEAGLRRADMMNTLNSSMRTITLVMTPVAAVLFALALPCVALILQHGKFDARSSVLVARALRVMAPGLIVFSIYKVVLPVFYAMKNTATPVRVGVLGTAIGLVLNILSVTLLPDGYQHAGLAGSVVISTLFTTSVLLVILEKEVGGVQFGKTGWSIVSTLISGAIMAAACGRVYSMLSSSGFSGTIAGGKFAQFIMIAIAGSSGGAVYFAARMLVGYEETVAALKTLVSLVRRRR